MLPRALDINLLPIGEVTNYSHPRCYMAPTENCSKKISKEHYISRAILEQMGELNVAGLPWHANKNPVLYSARDLTANILCTRHNSALSPLDSIAAHAFQAFVSAPSYVTRNLTPGRAQHYLVSGDGLQLWLIKLLAGLFYGGIASAEGERLLKARDINTGALIRALSGAGLEPGAGLYISQSVGEMPRKAIHVAPYTDTATNHVAGLRVNFGTILIEAFLTRPPEEGVRRMTAAGRYKPSVIDFNGPTRDARVVLTWPGLKTTVQRVGIELAPVT